MIGHYVYVTFFHIPFLQEIFSLAVKALALLGSPLRLSASVEMTGEYIFLQNY